MENGKEKNGNCKRGRGKLKMEWRKVWKWAGDFFFLLLSFFLSFSFFFLSLFETTEICLGCIKMEISTGKNAFLAGKKSRNVAIRHVPTLIFCKATHLCWTDWKSRPWFWGTCYGWFLIRVVGSPGIAPDSSCSLSRFRINGSLVRWTIQLWTLIILNIRTFPIVERSQSARESVMHLKMIASMNWRNIFFKIHYILQVKYNSMDTLNNLHNLQALGFACKLLDRLTDYLSNHPRPCWKLYWMVNLLVWNPSIQAFHKALFLARFIHHFHVTLITFIKFKEERSAVDDSLN